MLAPCNSCLLVDLGFYRCILRQLMSTQTSAEDVIELLKLVKGKLARLEQQCHKKMVVDGAIWNEEVST